MTPRSVAIALLKLAVLVGLIYLATRISGVITARIQVDLMPHNEAMIDKIILLGLMAYTLLMAMPFLPGAEIGLGLLAAFGAFIAPAVYLATVVALALAFSIGRLIPPQTTLSFLRAVGLKKTANRMQESQNLSYDELIQTLTTAKNISGFLCRYRYLTVILLVNLPGNILIGGGGGIAMAAGMSRLFHPVGFVIAIVIGVLPIPVAFLLMGQVE